MRIRPRENRVLLEVDDTAQTFAGGELIIARVPDKEGDYPIMPSRGLVLEAGPDVQDLEVGDYVICKRFNGVRLPKRQWEGRDLMLIREVHVLLKYTGATDTRFGHDWGDDSPRRR